MNNSEITLPICCLLTDHEPNQPWCDKIIVINSHVGCRPGVKFCSNPFSGCSFMSEANIKFQEKDRIGNVKKNTNQQYRVINALKDIESFCEGREKLRCSVSTSDDPMAMAFRDVKFLVRQHIHSYSKDNSDPQKIVQTFLSWLRSYRDTIIGNNELRHILNETCDRLDVLDSKIHKNT